MYTKIKENLQESLKVSEELREMLESCNNNKSTGIFSKFKKLFS
jgi:hypothetical protein